MNVETLKSSGRILYEFIGGSHAYGLNTPSSDEDTRGLFYNTKKELLSISASDSWTDPVSDSSNDTSYYSLKKFFDLAKDCNPNIIEFLFMPQDVIKVYNKNIMDMIIGNRHLFISKKCKHTFGGYAYAQIKKCKGANKWINNPKPAERPVQKDFCWVIPDQTAISKINIMPFRPMPLSEWEGIVGFKIEDCVCSKVEHTSNLYRLYFYGKNSKGVFRGGEIVTESISIEDELTKYCGSLAFNETEFEKSVKDWENYWEWRKNRNINRWVLQEKGEIDYDAKNVMHCIRILKSGINILKNGEPIVRFDGSERDFLMDVRNGKFLYDDIIKVTDSLYEELDISYKVSTLQHIADISVIDALYLKILDVVDDF